MAEMLEEESIINSILQMRLLKQKKKTKKARLEKKTGKVTSKLEKQK